MANSLVAKVADGDGAVNLPELMGAAIAGMAALGCRVLDVAMASTPAMFMSTVLPEFACHGAIMMTASHLPFNRNGLKALYLNANALQTQAVYRYEKAVLNAYIEVANQLSNINNLAKSYINQKAM